MQLRSKSGIQDCDRRELCSALQLLALPQLVVELNHDAALVAKNKAGWGHGLRLVLKC
jgi:hypothetical protein